MLSETELKIFMYKLSTLYIILNKYLIINNRLNFKMNEG